MVDVDSAGKRYGGQWKVKDVDDRRNVDGE